MIGDVGGALRQAILQDATILSLLSESQPKATSLTPSERVYFNQIPLDDIEAADTFHPPKMIVVRQAGGQGSSDYTEIDKPTVNLICYGESQYEADRLRRAVASRLIQLDRECHEGVLLHSLVTTGGPIPLVDPDIVWPAVSQGFSIVAHTEEAA